MTDRENDSAKAAGEGRLSRWSRLKTQVKDEQDVSAPTEPPTLSEPGTQVPEPAGDGPEEESFVLEDLPDIETLDKDSDFTPFLNINVPDEIRRLALRKLWASDPVLANLDGLNDYDEDYSALGMIAEKVSSLFKPGEGMPDPEPDPDPEPEPDLEPGQIQSETENLPPPPEEVAEANAGDDDAENPDDPETGSISDDGPGTDEAEAPSEVSTAGAQVPDDQADPGQDDPGETDPEKTTA